MVTITWALSFPTVKMGLDYASPYDFLVFRFPLGFLLMSPFLRGAVFSRDTFAMGAVLAVLLGGAFLMQTVGLSVTTPSRNAFITGMNVVMVPLLYPLLTRRVPATGVWIGAGLAGVGMFLLADPRGAGINRGDWLTLAAALFYALYIIVLEAGTRRYDYRGLLVVQFSIVCVLLVPPALLDSRSPDWGASELYLAFVATGLILTVTHYLHNRYQRDTTAPRAAVIFAGEPVFAAGFSYLMMGEVLGWVQVAGAGLILAGMLAAELREAVVPPVGGVPGDS